MWGTFRPYRQKIIVTNQSFSKALQRVNVRGPMNPFLSCKGCVPAIQLFKPPSQLHPAWQATIQCLQSRLWILRKDNIWQIIRGLNITTLQLGNRSSYRSRSVHHRRPNGDENHHDDK